MYLPFSFRKNLNKAIYIIYGNLLPGEIMPPTPIQYFNRSIFSFIENPCIRLFIQACLICHHIRMGSLPSGIMKRITRLSYFLHLYPQMANFPLANEMSSLKSLNKLPSTRAFSAAEKWTVRSTGVGGFISPQNGNLRR